jgi:hypothetical protein
MCLCPTRSLAAAIEDDILVTPPPSRYNKLRRAEGRYNALDWSCDADLKGEPPSIPKGLPDRYATSPAMFVALGDHDGMTGADPSEGVS